jgi:hypothetical protein
VRDEVARDPLEDFSEARALLGERLLEEFDQLGGRGLRADGRGVERAGVVGDEADGGAAQALVLFGERARVGGSSVVCF